MDIKLGSDSVNNIYLNGNAVINVYLNNVPIFFGTDAPVITSFPEFYINEGDTEVGQMTATDPNSYGLTFSVTSEMDGHLFDIDPVTGVLAFKNLPEFDIALDTGEVIGDNVYELFIVVTNTNNAFTKKPIKVTVININTTPTDILLTVDSILENTLADTEVGTLSCELLGILTYSLKPGKEGPDNSYFYITDDKLYTNTIFNYELKNIYNIQVEVTNGTISVAKTFSITITNVLELPTDILLSTNNIAEGNAINAIVGTLSFISSELTGSTPEYTLVLGDGDTDNLSFSIVDTNLKALEVFDYESISHDPIYYIRIAVNNDSGTFEKLFVIHITNINELPVFSSGTSLSLYENNTTVGTVVASDPDGSAITYSIVGGADANKFSINSTTGALTIYKDNAHTIAPDWEFPTDTNSDNVYEVIVRALDVSNLYTNLTINVTVLNSLEGLYYVSPTGNDNGLGTINSPFATVNRALNTIKSGDIIYLRGGTYNLTATIDIVGKNGTLNAPILIKSYLNEVAKITRAVGSTIRCGINIENSNYITLENFEIYGFTQTFADHHWNIKVIDTPDIPNTSSHYIRFNNIKSYLGEYGFAVGGYCDEIHFVNCDSYENGDPLSTPIHENSNGFSIHTKSTGNITFNGCRSWWNGDDGWDFFGSNATFTLDNCWAWWNGYVPSVYPLVAAGNGQGFKLGPATLLTLGNTKKITVRNCIAYRNLSMGFDMNTSRVIAEFYNNTAYLQDRGFSIYGTDSLGTIETLTVLKNNVSYGHTFGDNPYAKITAATILSNNNFVRSSSVSTVTNPSLTVTNADFVSLDYTQLAGTRKADGSLPDITFLKPIVGSQLINAGTYVGLKYKLPNPDVGYVEYGYDGTNQAPVIISTAFTVLEGTTTVGTIDAHDPDLNTITYSINGGADLSFFNINSSTGLLTFKVAPSYAAQADADNNNVYVVQIKVQDQYGTFTLGNISVTVTSNNTLLNNLVSYWKLDEAIQPLYDSVPSGNNDLTPKNALLNQTPLVGSGKSVSLDGTTSHLSCADSANLDFTDNFSISAWIKPTNISADHIIVLKGDLNNMRNGYSFYIHAGELWLDLGNATNVASTKMSNAVISTNTTYHVVFTHSLTVWKLYVDGVIQNTVGLPFSPTLGTNVFYIGENETDQYGFFGQIDEVAVWSKELTQSDVTLLYNLGIGNIFPF